MSPLFCFGACAARRDSARCNLESPSWMICVPTLAMSTRTHCRMLVRTRVWNVAPAGIQLVASSSLTMQPFSTSFLLLGRCSLTAPAPVPTTSSPPTAWPVSMPACACDVYCHGGVAVSNTSAHVLARKRRNGRPQPRAAEHDGAVLAGARRRKETRYPELAGPGPQRLVVLACEVGGRFGSEAFDLVRRLVRVRSLRAPAALRRSAAVAWRRRWWGLLGVALQRAVVSTLLGSAWLSPAQPAADAAPDLGDVLALGDAPLPSRLHLRG